MATIQAEQDEIIRLDHPEVLKIEDGRAPATRPDRRRRQDIPPSYGVKPGCLVVPNTACSSKNREPSAGNLRVAGGVGMA